MDKVRFGIVGLGHMGSAHANWIKGGQVPRGELAAVCDANPSRVAEFGVPGFEDPAQMIESGNVDAVIIATPHYAHTTVGIHALQHGLHVMVEKPISVHKADCERLLAAHKDSKVVFAAMFNQRADPRYVKIRNLIKDGELGAIKRVNWTATHWFRAEAYYNSGGWRATWCGEGGGVLLNQCPHQLDLFQWFFGMPVRVRAFAALGKYHDIEVEDDVTAYVEFANGSTGTLIMSTGECPGTNRLEIACDRGRLVFENDALSFTRTEVPVSDFCRNSRTGFDSPALWNVEVPTTTESLQHVQILRNFVEAILDGKALIAPAEEGIRSVELANAFVLSSLMDRTLELPMDSGEYERKLQELIANSTRGPKKAAEPGGSDPSFRC